MTLILYSSVIEMIASTRRHRRPMDENMGLASLVLWIANNKYANICVHGNGFLGSQLKSRF